MNTQETAKSEDRRGQGSWNLRWVILLSALLPWLAQPPFALWPISLLAVVPLLWLSNRPTISRREFLGLYAASAIYWATTLQGLRHAHPLIYPCWLVLAGYLGIYPVLFVLVLRRVRRWMPLELAAPMVWVAAECLRNYLLTGLSAAMLGHSLADIPALIQIADLGGTYLVSAMLIVVNVAIFQAVVHRQALLHAMPAIGLMLVVVAFSYLYGRMRLAEETTPGSTTFALIGRNEVVEYIQDKDRQIELYQAYARQSEASLRNTDRVVDVVVWPESMFTADLAWNVGDGNSRIAEAEGLTPAEVRQSLQSSRDSFEMRARSLQYYLSESNTFTEASSTSELQVARKIPHLLVGCGVINYGDEVEPHSGVVHIDSNGRVAEWYAKMHLVMFGEYVPIVSSIPGIRSLVPGNMGLTAGDGPRPMNVDGYSVCPNICVETAVERVTVNHFRTLLRSEQPLPHAVVSVSNDGWFDDSSVVQHHKRCAQLVAVATRRDILSAANNGPTVWIDRFGQVVEELPQGQSGAVIATPPRNQPVSIAVRYGDWPVRFVSLLVLVIAVVPSRHESVGDASS
ncbi:MAG: apolipoprotein N-acyltransferase [Planctomycetota bacterium]